MRPTNQFGKQITERYHDVEIIIRSMNRLLVRTVKEQKCNAHGSLARPRLEDHILICVGHRYVS